MGLQGFSSVLDDMGREGARPKMTFRGKLWRILTTIERIEKDKHNPQGNYKYASEAAIKERFHPLFAELGLLLVPVSVSDLQTMPPSGGKSSYITTFIQTFDLLDLENGSTLSIQVPASGGDSLDKGVWKGLTGAIKYALTTMFLIPTGDDPEGEGVARERKRPEAKQAVSDPNAPIAEGQVKRLHAIVTAHKIDRAAARDVLKKYGYESSKDIQVKHYDQIITELQGGR
jgi:hypothetical protein